VRIKIAVLDMDGTLLEGFLAAAMAQEIIDVGEGDTAAAGKALAAVQDYQVGRIDHDECARRFYDGYSRAVAGMQTVMLHYLGDRVWQNSQPLLFPFVHELLAVLRRRGFSLWLLSGSPEEAILPAARELGMDRAWGLALSVSGGRSTDQIIRAPALRGEKRTLLQEALPAGNVDWGRSLAIGDSSSDISVLEMVGCPMAFEPDPALRRIAHQRRWPVTDRQSILAHLQDVHSTAA